MVARIENHPCLALKMLFLLGLNNSPKDGANPVGEQCFGKETTNNST
jgi:hypothetical protein